LAEVVVRQEENEAVHDAFCDIRDDAAIERGEPVVLVIYLGRRIEEAGIIIVIAGGRVGIFKYSLDLEAGDDQVEGVYEELGDNGA
jgi:hypothetical protein